MECGNQKNQCACSYNPQKGPVLKTDKWSEVLEPDPLHIRFLLGNAAWLRLRPAIRKRFGCDAQLGNTHLYRGKMHRVDATCLGLLMAYVARFIGSPMAWSRGQDVPCDVITFDDPERERGIV